MASDRDEKLVSRGQREVYQEILNLALRGLGVADMPADVVSLQQRVVQLELLRAETEHALRKVCDEFGDNDWPANLHPADVLKKHLTPYLED